MGKVVFSDKSFIIYDKEPGEDSEKLPQDLKSSFEELYVVHRLDKPVSGLICLARTKEAAAQISRQITEGVFEKEYRCLAFGHFDEPKGEMRDFLYKDKSSGKTFIVKRERKGVKEAALLYEVTGERLYDNGNIISEVKVKLITGRSHQIRVQFAGRKHPLIGDSKYGSRIKGELALRSVRLKFKHPETGEYVEFT